MNTEASVGHIAFESGMPVDFEFVFCLLRHDKNIV